MALLNFKARSKTIPDWRQWFPCSCKVPVEITQLYDPLRDCCCAKAVDVDIEEFIQEYKVLGRDAAYHSLSEEQQRAAVFALTLPDLEADVPFTFDSNIVDIVDKRRVVFVTGCMF